LYRLFAVCSYVARGTEEGVVSMIDFTKDSEYIRLKKEGELFNNKGEKMKDWKDLLDQVLANKSLTVFLGIVVVALVFGWIGG
jgi:hypothetical protein